MEGKMAIVSHKQEVEIKKTCFDVLNWHILLYSTKHHLELGNLKPTNCFCGILQKHKLQKRFPEVIPAENLEVKIEQNSLS